MYSSGDCEDLFLAISCRCFASIISSGDADDFRDEGGEGNAGFMIVGGALKFCPKAVPPAEKARFEKAAASLKPAKK